MCLASFMVCVLDSGVRRCDGDVCVGFSVGGWWRLVFLVLGFLILDLCWW